MDSSSTVPGHRKSIWKKVISFLRTPIGSPQTQSLASMGAANEPAPDKALEAPAFAAVGTTAARGTLSLGNQAPRGTHQLGISDLPAVKAMDRLLVDALEARASDIHLEDHAGGFRVRYRIDGALEDVEPPEAALRAAVLARLRVMANLDLTEHRAPQDGRLRVPFDGRYVDVRVSTVPMLHGETVALRILDPVRGSLELPDLGLRLDDVARLNDAVSRPHGMVLTTGPGGSGKSTTLYSVLRRISSGKEKILTVEDPVEYDVEGVCQVSVDQNAGLTFPNLLRSLVRQDPDVLLVGEIRDGETAEIAAHAALTGHLVLSTLHTTDAPAALPRLLDLGVKEHVVLDTLIAVMAQRLVRQVCPQCAKKVDLTRKQIQALGPEAGGLTTGVQPAGCEACRGTGYITRTGLFELMVMTDPIREAFLARRSVREFRELAREEGMQTLREDGVTKIRAGITTAEEVLRVT